MDIQVGDVIRTTKNTAGGTCDVSNAGVEAVVRRVHADKAVIVNCDLRGEFSTATHLLAKGGYEFVRRPKFKVGDKVRISNEYDPEAFGLTKGQVVTITSVNPLAADSMSGVMYGTKEAHTSLDEAWFEALSETPPVPKAKVTTTTLTTLTFPNEDGGQDDFEIEVNAEGEKAIAIYLARPGGTEFSAEEFDQVVAAWRAVK